MIKIGYFSMLPKALKNLLNFDLFLPSKFYLNRYDFEIMLAISQDSLKPKTFYFSLLASLIDKLQFLKVDSNESALLVESDPQVILSSTKFRCRLE